MSRSAQAGFILFGPQVSKSTQPASPVFYKYRATDIDLGAVEPGGLLPPEIASIITPTGAYKMGAFGAGGMTIIPRLDGDFGWLLLGLMGEVSSAETPTGSGIYSHTFKFATDPTQTEWFRIQKFIPASTTYGEDFVDAKLARLRLTIPQAGPATARLDAVARVPTFIEDPSWTFETMDDGDAFAVAGASASYLKLPTFDAGDQPATGCIIEMTNMMTTPQQEFIIGSQYPDDFVVLQRAATIRWVYKWEDPDLTRIIFTGAKTGETAWTPAVYTSDFEAKVVGVDAEAIGDTGNEAPYSLLFDATKVVWEPNGPIRLMGNNILAQEYVGTAIEPPSGEYAVFVLANAETTYTWPAS